MPAAYVVNMLVRRCAWCFRVFRRMDGELSPLRQPLPERETPTICPNCIDTFQAGGLSR